MGVLNIVIFAASNIVTSCRKFLGAPCGIAGVKGWVEELLPNSLVCCSRTSVF